MHILSGVAGGQVARKGARERPPAQHGHVDLGHLVHSDDLGLRGDHGAAGGRGRLRGEEDRHGAAGDDSKGHDLDLGTGMGYFTRRA